MEEAVWRAEHLNYSSLSDWGVCTDKTASASIHLILVKVLVISDERVKVS